MSKTNEIGYCLPTFFFTPVTGVMIILRTDKTLLLLLLPAGSQR